MAQSTRTRDSIGDFRGAAVFKYINNMTRKELNDKLKELGLEHQYSLDGSLEPNQYILYHNYSKWEYFFFNEKGGREYIKTFFSEEEAYDYIYENALRWYNWTQNRNKYTPSQKMPQEKTITVQGDNFVMTYTEPKSQDPKKKD